MTTPQQRRDPQPIGRSGEVALVALAAVLMLLGFAALAGLGAAAALAGGGWVWPHGNDTIGSVLGGLLTGHPGRGLPPELAARVPGPVPVYSGVAVAELAMVVVATAGGVLFWRYHRPVTPAAGWRPAARPRRCSAGPGCARPAPSSGPT